MLVDLKMFALNISPEKKKVEKSFLICQLVERRGSGAVEV